MTKKLSIRIEEGLLADLHELARRQNISLTQLVVNQLRLLLRQSEISTAPMVDSLSDEVFPLGDWKDELEAQVTQKHLS